MRKFLLTAQVAILVQPFVPREGSRYKVRTYEVHAFEGSREQVLLSLEELVTNTLGGEFSPGERARPVKLYKLTDVIPESPETALIVQPPQIVAYVEETRSIIPAGEVGVLYHTCFWEPAVGDPRVLDLVMMYPQLQRSADLDKLRSLILRDAELQLNHLLGETLPTRATDPEVTHVPMGVSGEGLWLSSQHGIAAIPGRAFIVPPVADATT